VGLGMTRNSPDHVAAKRTDPLSDLHLISYRFGLFNPADRRVVQKLLTSELGTLDVDKVADPTLSKFRKEGSLELRVHLTRVYLRAANKRKGLGASKYQIEKVESALDLLERVFKSLNSLPHTTLMDALDISVENDSKRTAVKGQNERYGLTEAADEVNGLVAKSIIKLRHALAQEQDSAAKSEISGRRPERLRTLVEELHAWWLREVSPKLEFRIDASRSRRRVGLGQRKKQVKKVGAPFLDLAVALFSRLDKFKESEVQAAVNNVMSERRRRSNPP
jgi:hypothetical protein